MTWISASCHTLKSGSQSKRSTESKCSQSKPPTHICFFESTLLGEEERLKLSAMHSQEDKKEDGEELRDASCPLVAKGFRITRVVCNCTQGK